MSFVCHAGRVQCCAMQRPMASVTRPCKAKPSYDLALRLLGASTTAVLRFIRRIIRCAETSLLTHYDFTNYRRKNRCRCFENKVFWQEADQQSHEEQKASKSERLLKSKRRTPHFLSRKKSNNDFGKRKGLIPDIPLTGEGIKPLLFCFPGHLPA